MHDETKQSCPHLNQQLRLLGVQGHPGSRVYLWQCLGCKRTFRSHTALRDIRETEPLLRLHHLVRQ